MKNILIFAMFILSTFSFSNAISAGNAVPDIEGKPVMDSTGTEIGDVDRVAKQGAKIFVIIGLKDDLKEVAVPMSSVKVSSDGSVTTNLSRSKLESYEDIDPLDYTEVK